MKELLNYKNTFVLIKLFHFMDMKSSFGFQHFIFYSIIQNAQSYIIKTTIDILLYFQISL